MKRLNSDSNGIDVICELSKVVVEHSNGMSRKEKDMASLGIDVAGFGAKILIRIFGWLLFIVAVGMIALLAFLFG